MPGDATVPRDVVTRYFYDQYSRLAEVRDGTLLRHRFSHDGLGRLVRSEDADGNSVRNHCDDAGHRLAVIRAELILGSLPPRSEYFRTEVLYDGRGLPLQETDAIGNTTQLRYDSRRLVQQVSTPDGRIASYRYDIFGRLRDQSVRAGATTITASREYDPAGRLTAMVTPNGDRIEWQYDARGRLTATTGPTSACTYAYDLEGRMVEQVLPSALRLRSQYSPEGRLLQQRADATGYQPPAALPGYAPKPVEDIEYTYTPGGRISRVSEGISAVTLAYNSLGRVLRETFGTSSMEYGWDDAGRRSSLAYPGGRKLRYVNSPGGCLTSVEQVSAGAGYPGDPAAAAARVLATIARAGTRPSRVDVPGIIQVAYAFDAARRLVGIDYGTGAPIDRLRVLHGGAGERLLDESANGLRVYDYDALRRLHLAKDLPTTELSVASLAPASDEASLALVVQQTAIDLLAQGAAAGGALRRSFQYDLDLAGNRLGTTTVLGPGGAAAVTSYVPMAGNRYAQVNSLATVYDRDGNLLDDGTRSFRYDVLGRLREASGDGVTTTAGYDPFGRLSDLSGGPAAVRCRWAGLALVELDQGTALTQLVPSERLLGQLHVAAGGRDLVPLQDDIGSVIGWAGAAGARLGTRLYDPFGRPLSSSGVDPAPLGFAGYILAPQTELYWLAARVYDARLGRFLQPDPMGFVDGLNVYAFARNAPGTFIDLLGFKSIELDWGSVAWNATKTVAGGVVIVGGAAALVGAGVVSAPARRARRLLRAEIRAQPRRARLRPRPGQGQGAGLSVRNLPGAPEERDSALWRVPHRAPGARRLRPADRRVRWRSRPSSASASTRRRSTRVLASAAPMTAIGSPMRAWARPRRSA